MGSLASSTRRPVEFSRCSLRTSSGTPSPTPNTPRGRPSPPWMWSMPSRGRDAPSTDSEVKQFFKLPSRRTTIGSVSHVWVHVMNLSHIVLLFFKLDVVLLSLCHCL